MIKAILMDFNGVIINDEPLQLKAYQEVLKNEGIDLTEGEYYGCLGMDDQTFTAAAFKRAGKRADEAKIAAMVEAKSERWKSFVAETPPLFSGIENFIVKMSREFALGIVSMASRGEIQYILDKSDLTAYFGTIVSAENVTRCKPDPQCFRIGFVDLDAARSANGHAPMTHDECLVIEDSPPGVAGARTAGLPVLGVTNTVSADELRSVGAGAIALSLSDWMPESIHRVFD